jgi:hypothetical protein
MQLRSQHRATCLPDLPHGQRRRPQPSILHRRRMLRLLRERTMRPLPRLPPRDHMRRVHEAPRTQLSWSLDFSRPLDSRRALGRPLDSSRARRPLDSSRARPLDLSRALDLGRPLDLSRALDLGRPLDLSRARPLNLSRASRSLDLSRASRPLDLSRALDLSRPLDSSRADLGRALGRALDLGQTPLDLSRLHEALRSLTGLYSFWLKYNLVALAAAAAEDARRHARDQFRCRTELLDVALARDQDEQEEPRHAARREDDDQRL